MPDQSGPGPKAPFSVLGVLVLGLVFHLVFINSVFDCYFTSPVVHGMQHFRAPAAEAKRLVLIVGAYIYGLLRRSLPADSQGFRRRWPACRLTVRETRVRERHTGCSRVYRAVFKEHHSGKGRVRRLSYSRADGEQAGACCSHWCVFSLVLGSISVIEYSQVACTRTSRPSPKCALPFSARPHLELALSGLET
jgi:hypothetical protein